MRFLLDTQIIIWLEKDESRLSEKASKSIFTESVLFVSKVSIWEVAIKVKTGKFELGKPIDEFIKNFIKSYRCELLDISLPHIYQTQQLPLHHRDPFDRLLIAQATIEQIPIVSSDQWFDQYEIERVW